jgi:two-component system alkaline phosphatase synthesis response regulator PhoP
MKSILLAEDENNIADIIELNLEYEGYYVTKVTSGKEALQILKTKMFDGIILDVMLPEVDGFTICEVIRTMGIQTPILFLTAKADVESRIMGLKIGGSDYLTKPFALEELLLRVKLLFNKPNIYSVPDKKELIKINGWTVDFENYKVFNQHSQIELSKKECDLLFLLYVNKNKVVSRDDILKAVWANETIPTPRTIDNFILRFRKIFETNPSEPKLFISIRGVGYKLEMS